MSIRRTMASIALAATAFAGVAAGTSEPEDHLVDIAGDANFINGQGFVLGLEGTSGPMQVPGADLQGIRFETVRNGNLVDGIRVHVRMDQPAGGSGPDVVIRTVANINGCPTMISANSGVTQGINGYFRVTDAAACGNPEEDYGATGTADYREGVLVESTDTGFSVTLSFSEGLPAWAKGFLKEGATITEVNAHTRTILVAATVPVVDELEDPAFVSWKIGSDA